MDWTEGYASDVEYTAGFYREQAPAYLNFTCLLNGVEPVDLTRPFTYFELGFGRGVTANVLAAANPLGRFYAADFNPGHVAGARQMADQAGLDNLVLLENSFDELANGQVPDLPPFDFITLHGIYTWITAENRAHIVAFLSRYLKPGGIVYLSYNAMPGWAVSMPLQRFIIEHAELNPGRSDAQIKGAREFIGKIRELKTGYLSSPVLEKRLEALGTADPHYLVHEYMHKHWQPMYFADVARELAAAKLEYVGPADLSETYPGLFLGPEKLALMNQVDDPIFKQTIKDYLMNTSFRKDVFVRGARRMSVLRQAEALKQVGVALTVEPEATTNVLKLPNGEVSGKAELYLPFLEALRSGPKTLAELGQLPALAETTMGNLAQVAALLTSCGQIAIYFPAAVQPDAGAALRLNRTLAAQTRFGDDYQVLASHLLGTGVATNFLERMMVDALAHGIAEHDTPALASAALANLKAQGRTVMKGDQPLSDPDASLAEVVGKVDSILAMRLPLWRTLKML